MTTPLEKKGDLMQPGDVPPFSGGGADAPRPPPAAPRGVPALRHHPIHPPHAPELRPHAFQAAKSPVASGTAHAFVTRRRPAPPPSSPVEAPRPNGNGYTS
ncbi:hypothetical protein T484DRAFT_1896521 [Baffinella frigidus]|nr:hypothetical protein T484DRAFT_1896521 [Cryptophyta sp. CCMP2293]